MALTKIESSELTGKRVSDLPDIPEMTAAELKKQFDKVSEDITIPKFNTLVSELESENGAEELGIAVPEGITANNKVASVMAAVAKIAVEASKNAHSHENKSVLDAITSTVKETYDKLVSMFANIKSVSDTISDDSTLLPTGKAIVSYMQKLGSGDMQASVYDKNGNGIVDNSEKLGGIDADKYQKVTDESFETKNKTVPGAINELLALAQGGGKALVGNEFSEDVDYFAGDYAIKENVLYKFTADKEAGEWGDSVVVATTVNAELADTDERMAAIESQLQGVAVSDNGTLTYSIAAGATITNVISFNKTFNTIPTVLASAVTSAGYASGVEVVEVTKGGFSCTCGPAGSSKTTATLTWNATASLS